MHTCITFCCSHFVYYILFFTTSHNSQTSLQKKQSVKRLLSSDWVSSHHIYFLHPFCILQLSCWKYTACSRTHIAFGKSNNNAMQPIMMRYDVGRDIMIWWIQRRRKKWPSKFFPLVELPKAASSSWKCYVTHKILLFSVHPFFAVSTAASNNVHYSEMIACFTWKTYQCKKNQPCDEVDASSQKPNNF